MFAAITSLTALGLTLGGLLGLAARHLRVEGNPLVEQVVERLPGSQCGQCGFPGCAPAAEAMVSGAAPLTICPAGGRELVEELAGLLGVSVDLSGVARAAPMIAVIQEPDCTGCTKCLKRCPTDAILGANNMVHVVFAEACTGCGQCVTACPNDCIELRPLTQTLATWHWPKPSLRPGTPSGRGQGLVEVSP